MTTYLNHSPVGWQWSMIESNGSLLDVDQVQHAGTTSSTTAAASSTSRPSSAGGGGDNEMPVTVSSTTHY